MTPPEPNLPDDDRSPWLTALINTPRQIAQPFSLSALSLVSGVILGVFGPIEASLSCIGVSAVLLTIGVIRTPSQDASKALESDSYKPVSDLKSSTSIEGAKIVHNGPDGLGMIEALCFLHLYQIKGGSIGRNRTFPVDYFVDLMTASLVPAHLDIMVRELARHIRKSGHLTTITTIASPKRGNSLLLAMTAHELDLQPIFIKERPLFGKMLEGIGGSPKVAAIVDDISSDGELLVNCVKEMRSCGYRVERAFVLIDRTEGDSIEALADIGVELLPMIRLNDQELEDIVGRARRTRAP
jgi:orotate phosphoribosyltransferase